MCDQPGYRLKNIPDVPNARYLSERVLSLPLYPSLTLDQCDHMISLLNKWK